MVRKGLHEEMSCAFSNSKISSHMGSVLFFLIFSSVMRRNSVIDLRTKVKIRLNQIRLNICCFCFWLLVFFVFQSWCKVCCKILIEAFKSSMFACFIHCCNIRFNQQIMHAYSIFSILKIFLKQNVATAPIFIYFLKSCNELGESSHYAIWRRRNLQ